MKILPVIAVLLFSSHAFADAEIRLYSGQNDSDLQQKIAIDSASGSVTVIKYIRRCGAYGSCGPMEVSRRSVTAIPADDLAALNAATAKVDSSSPHLRVVPAKTDFCQYFARFEYGVTGAKNVVVSAGGGKIQCEASRLNSPEGETIERVLDAAATNAGY